MGRAAILDLGIIAAVIVIVGGVLLYITRKTHIISWRFGIFFESEERFNGGKGSELPKMEGTQGTFRPPDAEDNDGGKA